MFKRWGAFEEDWDHFTLVLGLDEDLLPAVANPEAKISPLSKMKALGKTPSRYNQSNLAVGFSDWTSYKATTKDIDLWAGHPDYSICLQTRRVRAFDIDVSDPILSMKISKFIFSKIGLLPTRLRSNSGKQLLAFRLQGEFPKRTMKVEGGILEMLGNGQQFLASGTHISGVRYEWAGSLPFLVPELTAEQFEQLWTDLTSAFALEPPSEGSTRLPRINIVKTLDDPVSKFLAKKELILSFGKEGQLYIHCPWRAEHTGDSGETQTAYFPAGGRGYKSGHFRCLHAHCAHRTDQDFLTELGYTADGFKPIMDMNGVELKKELPWPGFRRNQAGVIKADLNNLLTAFRNANFAGVELRHDSFRDEIVVYAPQTGKSMPLTDVMLVNFRRKFELRGFDTIGRELIRDAVLEAADEKAFDSAQDWLNSLIWDGIPRIERFLSRYIGAQDNPYTRAVGQYLWSALAGRVANPGIKADMVPILIGPQGRGKSSTVAAMAPSPEFFAEISLQDKDDNLSRLMRGRLVGEIAELRGLHTRDLESINAFITRTHEKWIPKFREFATDFARRLVFIGTTNQDEFLADETGNRRWLPVHVTQADLRCLNRDRDQLWAEGREMFELFGIMWQDAERLARAVHGEHMIFDSWQEPIEKWLREIPFDTNVAPILKETLQTGEILNGALGISTAKIRRADEVRLTKIMKKIGYRNITLRENDTVQRVWAKS